MSGGSEDRDMLAAEYVLGSIERHEARVIEAMAEGDPKLAAAITEWQDRLAPLARLVPPSQAPQELWDRLENAIAPVLLTMPAAKPRPAARAWGSVGFWRGTTVGALALAAAIAGLAIVRNPPEPRATPVYLADLAPTGATGESAPHGAAAETAPRVAAAPAAQSAATTAGPAGESAQHAAEPFAQSADDVAGSTADRFQPAAAAPGQPAPSASGSTLQPTPEPSAPPAASAARFMVASMPDGSILVKPMGPVPVAPGKDLELWAQPPGAQRPMPVGVLPAGGLRVAMADIMQPNTKLMVSMEPQGGSPSGQPTGAVLYSGALTRVE